MAIIFPWADSGLLRPKEFVPKVHPKENEVLLSGNKSSINPSSLQASLFLCLWGLPYSSNRLEFTDSLTAFRKFSDESLTSLVGPDILL